MFSVLKSVALLQRPTKKHKKNPISLCWEFTKQLSLISIYAASLVHMTLHRHEDELELITQSFNRCLQCHKELI